MVTWLSPSEGLDHLRLAAEIAGIEADPIVLPQERELVVRGLALHYLDWGTCGRPPIVFLHGACSGRSGSASSRPRIGPWSRQANVASACRKAQVSVRDAWRQRIGWADVAAERA